VKENESVIMDATKRIGDQIRTIAVAELTKPAAQIATEVMEMLRLRNTKVYISFCYNLDTTYHCFD